MRHAILAAILLSSCATCVRSEQPRTGRQSFIVIVPPKLEAEQSDRYIRFRSSVPVLIRATDNVSEQVVWTRTVHVGKSQAVELQPLQQASGMMLTIVPLY